MITGIGVDVIEIDRISRSIDRFGGRFLSKIFTAAEIEGCTGNAQSGRRFAELFAAKEAVSKAMATGNTGDFGWLNVEVIFDEKGKPGFRFYNAMEQVLEGCSVFLSLSHSEQIVIACVTIVRDR